MNNTDYLRQTAINLKDAGVSSITPDQLEELAYYIDSYNLEKQLKEMTENP